MPLLTNILEQEIRKITDEEYVQFEGFPEDAQEAADRWANAFDVYFSGITSATPLTPAARDAAVNAASGTFLGLFQEPKSGAALASMQTGFVSYVDAIVGPMTSSDPTFTWVIPSAPLLAFSTPFATGKAQGTPQAVAQQMILQIDPWIKTGLLISKVQPGPTLTWV